MPGAMTDPLVDTNWLAEHLSDPKIRILDGSFHLPGSGRDPRQDYARMHIEGARFFDIDGICDRSTDLPHMLPAEGEFAAAVSGLGISNEHQIIVYDGIGSAAAARVWWTFRAFSHDRIAVLDGGLAKWLAEGRPVTATTAPPALEVFRARLRRELVSTAEELLRALPLGTLQIIDNRGAGRYRGEEPEPRPVARFGHIPGSINIPFNAFFAPERGGCWRTPDELRTVFAKAGVDLERPTVASCGSGVTAATTAFAAFRLGVDEIAVYDGSWAEWGNRDDTQVER